MPLRSSLPSLLALLLAAACTGPAGPGPQEANFPKGSRTSANAALQLELTAARYEMRLVSIEVALHNPGQTALTLERQGILLEYNQLEFPVTDLGTEVLANEIVVDPGATIQLQLGFVTEQALLEAAKLHVMSIRRGPESWAEPLTIAVPPPAAFVDAATEPDPEA
ncbi:MAG: hypothetical protein AAF799_12000 [Myxococcota bacterium]